MRQASFLTKESPFGDLGGEGRAMPLDLAEQLASQEARGFVVSRDALGPTDAAEQARAEASVTPGDVAAESA